MNSVSRGLATFCGCRRDRNFVLPFRLAMKKGACSHFMLCAAITTCTLRAVACEANRRTVGWPLPLQHHCRFPPGHLAWCGPANWSLSIMCHCTRCEASPPPTRMVELQARSRCHWPPRSAWVQCGSTAVCELCAPRPVPVITCLGGNLSTAGSPSPVVPASIMVLSGAFPHHASHWWAPRWRRWPC